MTPRSSTLTNTSRTRRLLWAAWLVSAVFSPLYITVYACALVLTMSYVSFLPAGFKIAILTVVWFFTVLLPRMFMYVYRRKNHLSRSEADSRRRRSALYVFTLTCYVSLLYFMVRLLAPHVLVVVVLGATVVALLCCLVNLCYKISSHAASTGGAAGLLMAFSLVYGFDATGWICGSVLFCGLICSARLVLRRHTLGEIGVGVAVGFLGALVSGLI